MNCVVCEAHLGQYIARRICASCWAYAPPTERKALGGLIHKASITKDEIALASHQAEAEALVRHHIAIFDIEKCPHWDKKVGRIINDGLDYMAECRRCGIALTIPRLVGTARERRQTTLARRAGKGVRS